MKLQPRPIFVQPGTGKELLAFENTFSVILGDEKTEGTLALVFESTPPDGGPPLHIHRHEDELYIVGEGRISYFVEGRWTEVGIGDLI